MREISAECAGAVDTKRQIRSSSANIAYRVRTAGCTRIWSIICGVNFFAYLTYYTVRSFQNVTAFDKVLPAIFSHASLSGR